MAPPSASIAAPSVSPARTNKRISASGIGRNDRYRNNHAPPGTSEVIRWIVPFRRGVPGESARGTSPQRNVVRPLRRGFFSLSVRRPASYLPDVFFAVVDFVVDFAAVPCTFALMSLADF